METIKRTVFRHGTVFFDGGCGLCSATELRWRAWFNRHGFETAFLQDDDLANDLPLELRMGSSGLILRLNDGQVLTGVDALARIASTAWWGKPLAILADLPGFHSLARWGYAWIAKRRNRISKACGLRPALDLQTDTQTKITTSIAK